MKSLWEKLFGAKQENTQRGGGPDLGPDIIFIDPRELFAQAKGNMSGNPSRDEVERALMGEFLRLAYMQSRAQSRSPQYCWNDDTFDSIANIATDLTKRYPNTRFFGLGNSPSYIVYGIDCLSPSLEQPAQTGYIPFSGRYLDMQNRRRRHDLVYRIDRDSPSYYAALENKDAYRKRLTSLGLNPKTIVDNFRKSGERTAIIDNIQSGTGFSTFIHLMYGWANELGYKPASFERAFKSIALTDERIPDHISIPEAGLNVPIDRVAISHEMRYALNGNMSADTDRFVPRYEPEEWGQPPEAPSARNREVVTEVKAAVRGAVERKVAQRPVFHLPDNAPKKGL